MAQKDISQTEPGEAPEGQKPTCAKRGLHAPSGTAPTVAHMPGEYMSKTMPHTATGATTNPWLAHVKKCAEMYQKEKEEGEGAEEAPQEDTPGENDEGRRCQGAEAVGKEVERAAVRDRWWATHIGPRNIGNGRPYTGAAKLVAGLEGHKPH